MIWWLSTFIAIYVEKLIVIALVLGGTMHVALSVLENDVNFFCILRL